MCARFVVAIPQEMLEGLFGVAPPEGSPRYNVAPSQDVLAITANDHRREAHLFQWGLIPSWAKDPAIGQRLINARAETAAEKPAFRSAFKNRRCVIPATGFIEWSHRTDEDDADADRAQEGRLPFDDIDPPKPRKGAAKQPFLLTLKDAPAFGLAGLWERWNSPSGPVDTCTILTTEPNELVAQLHDRMPCILDQDGIAAWLSDEPTSALTPLLAPFPAERMRSIPIDPRINNPRHEGPDLLRPIESP